MKKQILALVLLLAPVAPTAFQAFCAPVLEHRVAEQPEVSVDKGYLELRAPEGMSVTFEVYSITGQIIKSVTVKSGVSRLELPKGFYIIKCERWTKRVMIK